MDVVTLALLEDEISEVAPELIAEATDDWLEDNIAQETGYVLDSTLTMSNAAAPAKTVGDALTAQSEAIGEIKEQTYNLVIGKIAGKTINGSGQRVTNTGTDLWAAPVEQGKNYTVKTDDTSGLVCGFFTVNPITATSATTYNSSRTIQANNYTITAPIDGYIAFRSSSSFESGQVVEGSSDKDYMPPITATDFVARAEIDELSTDIETAETAIAKNASDIADITDEHQVYEKITNPTITDNYFKKFGDGTDSEANTFEYASVSVSAGEVFKISCMAGQWAKPWIVLNSLGGVVSYSSKATSEAVSQTDETVTIPTNGATLVVNHRKDGILDIEKYTGTELVFDNDKILIDGDPIEDVVDGINNANILQGKVLCACGDSITYGTDMDESGITNTSNITVFQSDASGNFTNTTSGFLKTWNYQIASRNGMTLYNAGVAGSTMEDVSEKSGFSKANGRYTKLPDNIDYLLIWFGWNDTEYGTLGAITDDANTSFYGAYNVVLPYLINKYPDAKIGLIVPFGCDAEHREAVRLLGNKWGVAVWDNYQGGTPLYYGKETSVGVEASVVTANQTKFQASGAHPNYKGHTELGHMIEHWMRGI